MNSPSLAFTDADATDAPETEADFLAFLNRQLVEADRLSVAMVVTQRRVDENWPQLQRELDELRAKVCGSNLAIS